MMSHQNNQFTKSKRQFVAVFCIFILNGFAIESIAQSLAEVKASAAAEKVRADQLARLRAATGADASKQALDPEFSAWVDSVIKAIKPWIVFNPDTYVGVSASVFQIELAPDGQILNQTLVSSSGDLNWDKAALTAIEKTKFLPKNSRGVIPQRSVRISFYPK